MKKILHLCLLLCVLLFSAACTREPETPEPVPKKPPAPAVRIAAGQEPGTYSRIAAELEKSLLQSIPDAEGDTVHTNGSIANIELLRQKKVEFALAQEDVAELAFTGKGPFMARPFQAVRFVASLHMEAVHLIVPTGSPIHSIKDLRHRRIALNAPGSGSEVTFRHLLRAFHVKENELQIQFLPADKILKGIADGSLDAAFLVMGAPCQELKPFLAGRKVHLLSLEGPELEALFERYAYYHPVRLEPGFYEGQSEPVMTVGVRCLLLASEDLPGNVADTAARILHGQLGALQRADESLRPLKQQEIFPVIGVPLLESSVKYRPKTETEAPDAESVPAQP